MKSLRMLAALLMGAVFALSACTSSSASDGSYTFNGATKLGTVIAPAKRKPVHAFTGSLLDGGTFNLEQDFGKVTVINFWGSWCAPCRVETPQFGLVYDKYKSKDVTFLGVDVMESGRDNPKAFVKENHISYPNVYDEGSETAVRLGNIRTSGMPFTVILDKQHRVAAVYLERLAATDLEPVLNKLIAES